MIRKAAWLWLLAGLTTLTVAAALALLFDEFSATRHLLDDGLLLALVIAAFVLTPPLLIAVFALGRSQSATSNGTRRLFVRLAVGLIALCWLAVTPPALLWGALIVAAREPWPLSRAQGPDTERARAGAAHLFGAETAQAMSTIYLFSFNLRDGSYFVRFDYADQRTIDAVVARKDLVRVPPTVRADARFDLTAHRTRWPWWNPAEINQSPVMYVDRPTSEQIAGVRPLGAPSGLARVLWLRPLTRTAYYRELEF